MKYPELNDFVQCKFSENIYFLLLFSELIVFSNDSPKTEIFEFQKNAKQNDHKAQIVDKYFF